MALVLLINTFGGFGRPGIGAAKLEVKEYRSLRTLI
jgi:hypothetical protein